MPIIFQYIPKEPIFTKEEFLRFANIADNAGQVFMGTIVIAPLVTGFDNVNLLMVVLGAVVTFLSWTFSWWLTRKTRSL